MEYVRFSWDDIEKQCIVLAEKIREQAIPYDIIIGISRGGWVPARILSDILGNDEVDSMRVKFYESVGQTATKPKIIHPTQIEVNDKNVLLVDDIADTGESLISSLEHLKERGAGKIFVATLAKKPHSKFTPDFFVEETDLWVIFPWEINETARCLKARYSSDAELRKEMEKAGLSP